MCRMAACSCGSTSRNVLRNRRRLSCVRVSARGLIATYDVRMKIGRGFQALSASVESRLQHADLEEQPHLFTASSVSLHLAGIGRKDDAETRRDFPRLQAGQRVAGRLFVGCLSLSGDPLPGKVAGGHFVGRPPAASGASIMTRASAEDGQEES